MPRAKSDSSFAPREFERVPLFELFEQEGYDGEVVNEKTINSHLYARW